MYSISDIRVGTGYDVHRFADNRACIIGGVQIPFDKGLLGHSDADVLIHAVVDALLGASSLGDIGRLYPDNDLKNIIKYTREILEKAIKLGGSTIHSYESAEGVTGRFQNELNVHTKDICPVCGTKIVKIKVNGRGTYYCHNCQK